ncbi:MAG: hypothetical protein AAGI38_23815, partial [Bacteroidota bacterium]
MRPQLKKIVATGIVLLLWLMVLLLNVAINWYSGLYAHHLSLPIKPFWYQLAVVVFFLGSALYIRQVFSDIDRLDVIPVLWKLFIIGMVGITLMLGMLVVNRL